ncbi:MAG: diguanylate cyclase [Gammaproteobacteria bacterium]|nr:MAG: diguanylate cyclase [Gammaproteobacteria bacterium]
MIDDRDALDKNRISTCASKDTSRYLFDTDYCEAGPSSNTPCVGSVISRSLVTAAHDALKTEISGLQVIPAVAVKLLQLTNDEHSSFDELIRVIETEPSLSAEVLRLVNSAFYGLPHKVNSIKRAVTLVGFSMVRQLALNLMFFKKLKGGARGRRLDQMCFWQHSLFVAAMSKIIAIDICHPEPDRAYSAGLLHDIGKMLLESFGKVSYSDFLQSFEKSENSLLDNELCFFGINHAQMGAVFCNEYKLPDSITQAVLNHHSLLTDKFEPELQKDIAIVSFANFIASIQGMGSTGANHCVLPQPGLLECIGKMNLNMESILEKVDHEIRGLSNFYNVPFPSLSRLRANTVNSVFSLGKPLSQRGGEISGSVPGSASCLTVPHHSLNPDEFIPWTLEAIQHDFHCDRLFMLYMEPKKRSLVARFQWPEQPITGASKTFELHISSLTGRMVRCLRRRQVVHIDRESQPDIPLLDALSVDEFFAVPVSTHNRLSAVLYIDNALSHNQLNVEMLPELSKVAAELGIALVNAKQYERERKKAQFDALTGLNNRRVINRFLNYLFAEAKAKLKGLAIGFIDVDHFKQFNDRYGHQSGDDVLRLIADTMKSLTRPGDFIGRFGGEEFLFVLLHTDERGAVHYAERIRNEIAERGKLLQRRFPDQQLTASIGVALYRDSYDDYQKMVEVADEAMYQAKSNGRNQVVVR